MDGGRAPPPVYCTLVGCDLVGGVGVDAHAEKEVWGVREIENTKDKNAILINTASSKGGEVVSLGYLPAGVALQLAPLLGPEAELRGTCARRPTTSEADESLRVTDEAYGVASTAKITWLRLEYPSDATEGMRERWDKARTAGVSVTSVQSAMSPSTRLCNGMRKVLSMALARGHAILSEGEKEFTRRIIMLAEEPMELFSRLSLRVGPYFKVNSLKYNTIRCVTTAVECLRDCGLVTENKVDCLPNEPDTKTGLEELLTTLDVGEIRELLLKLGNTCRTGKREELTQRVVASVTSQTRKFGNDGNMVSSAGRSSSTIYSFTGRCIRVAAAVDDLMKTLGFLLSFQPGTKAPELVRSAVGQLTVPTYTMRQSRDIFSNRSVFDAYRAAAHTRASVDEAIEMLDFQRATLLASHAVSRVLSNTLPRFNSETYEYNFLDRFQEEWELVETAWDVVPLLEREKKYEQANSILRSLLGISLCPHRRGMWWNRLAINTEHLGKKMESLELVEAGLADDFVRGGERLSLQRRCLRLGKPPVRWKKPPFSSAASWEAHEIRIKGVPISSTVGKKSFFYNAADTICSVEELSLEHYRLSEGWTGVHCEGGIWSTLFGLLFWDIIFADVADVFQTRFQSAPLDLGGEAFYASRKDAIEDMLAKLYEGNGSQIIGRNWANNYGMQCRGVNWSRFDLEQLQTVAACIGGRGLKEVCKVLSHSYDTSGMPDLLLWRESDGAAKAVEVKGPNDSLSDKQRVWLRALNDAGVPCEVCKVVDRDEKLVPTQRRKKRKKAR